ncbi:MAG: peptidoglycan-associated lipoprotein [Rhodobacteraceae bacterium]|nr:peptidoglycan-associated lipoprotein [Paracoccaceae bacterium]
MKASVWLMGLAVAGMLAACSKNDAFEDVNNVDLNNQTAGAVAGTAGDPTSPVYFQQAVGDRVFFLVDQSTLNDDARTTLDAQASWLLQNTDYVATIEGHADEQGTREYNVALGERRANAAREYLISRGVAGNRLKIVSYGKERPVEICSVESCYAKNRRAVTVLAAGLTG